MMNQFEEINDIDYGFFNLTNEVVCAPVVPNTTENATLYINPIYSYNEVFRPSVHKNGIVLLKIPSPYSVKRGKIYECDNHYDDALRLRFAFNSTDGRFFACSRNKKLKGYISENFDMVVFENTSLRDVRFIYWLLQKSDLLPSSNEIFINGSDTDPTLFENENIFEDIILPVKAANILNGIPKAFVAIVMISMMIILEPIKIGLFEFSPLNKLHQFILKNAPFIIPKLKCNNIFTKYNFYSVNESLKCFPHGECYIYNNGNRITWDSIDNVLSRYDFSDRNIINEIKMKAEKISENYKFMESWVSLDSNKFENKYQITDDDKTIGFCFEIPRFYKSNRNKCIRVCVYSVTRIKIPYSRYADKPYYIFYPNPNNSLEFLWARISSNHNQSKHRIISFDFIESENTEERKNDEMNKFIDELINRNS